MIANQPTLVDNIIVWELNEITVKKKFQRLVTVCKYFFGLNVNLDKCVVMKMSQKAKIMEKMKCNNH
jgi:hypothetical protein